MKNPEHYGDTWADVYDEYTASVNRKTQPIVDFLADLKSRGPLLELGLGTGRVSLALLDLGVSVHAMESSSAMLERFYKKPRANEIVVHKGDYSNFSLKTKFQLVLAAFDAVCMLFDPKDQISCFTSVAAALEPSGLFIVESDLPDYSSFIEGVRISVVRSSLDCLELQIVTQNPADQAMVAHHVTFSSAGVQWKPVGMRYISIPEMDLMAHSAGLELAERYSGWDKADFTFRSRTSVSVYRLRTGRS